jgi:hypothetical protein
VNSQRRDYPEVDPDAWIASPEEIAAELASVKQEFDSFTPERFAELKFHLLGPRGLTKSARDDFCRISIHDRHCRKCERLYETKKCLLWSRLFKIITWDTVKRAPPCIRHAFASRSIKTVANYLAHTSVISPPYFRSRFPPSCKMMQNWGYCTPNEYCGAMKTGKIIEYNDARNRVKMSRKIK